MYVFWDAYNGKLIFPFVDTEQIVMFITIKRIIIIMIIKIIIIIVAVVNYICYLIYIYKYNK